MPELTAIHFGLLVLMLAIGVITGWILRSDRCAKEKIAVSASWQEQLESQQSEHNRLAEQNKSLMEQISQYQASQKDYSNRAKELSGSLREALAKRDELQRQMKDIRGNLEVAIAQRDRLKDNLQSKNVSGQAAALKEKDDKIFRLSRELTSWQSRVPPLVERFQDRDKQARQLEGDLEKAHTRLSALETMIKSDQTRIEPVDADSLPDGGDASNEPIAVTSAHDTLQLQDQVEGHVDDEPAESEFMSMDEFDEPAATEIDDEVTKEFSAVFDVPDAGSGESDDEKYSAEDLQKNRRTTWTRTKRNRETTLTRTKRTRETTLTRTMQKRARQTTWTRTMQKRARQTTWTRTKRTRQTTPDEGRCRRGPGRRPGRGRRGPGRRPGRRR